MISTPNLSRWRAGPAVKKVCKIIVGFFLAGALDMAGGILIAFFLLKTFPGAAPKLQACLAGAVFAVFPDVDGLKQIKTIIREGRLYVDHRLWTHYPLVVLPIAAALLAPLSPFYAILAVLCLLFHYVHDSLDLEENGEGIKWLAPLRHHYYHLSWKKIRSLKVIIRLTAREAEKLKHKKETMEEWLEKHYLKISPHSLSGVFVLFVSIFTAILW